MHYKYSVAYLKNKCKYFLAALINETVCLETHLVVIEETCVIIDGEPVVDLDKFAIADGFKNWQEMIVWFKKTHNLPFYGDLIIW